MKLRKEPGLGTMPLTGTVLDFKMYTSPNLETITLSMKGKWKGRLFRTPGPGPCAEDSAFSTYPSMKILLDQQNNMSEPPTDTDLSVFLLKNATYYG